MLTLLQFPAPLSRWRLRAGLARKVLSALTAVLVACAGWGGAGLAHAEYGDVIINNYSDAAGMRPAVFPHWFHRIRFACKVCHADLGFKFKAGGNEINMVKIIDGQFCGACHNGDVAWSVENCDLCHTGNAGTKTQVHGSTTNSLVAPGGSKPAATQPKK